MAEPIKVELTAIAIIVTSVIKAVIIPEPKIKLNKTEIRPEMITEIPININGFEIPFSVLYSSKTCKGLNRIPVNF